jgi:hypothetical protein
MQGVGFLGRQFRTPSRSNPAPGRSSRDAVHTVEGEKVRLLIVTAYFACVALHYASVKFGQSRELVPGT